MSEKQQPEKKFRSGAISATIWKNTQKGQDGKEFDFFTVSIERNYMKDPKDENSWASTSSMRTSDLPKVAMLSNKAFEYLSLKEDN